MNNLRIGQVHYQFPAEGGQERHVLNISQELVKLGDDVTVFTSNYLDSDKVSIKEKETIKGINVNRMEGVFTNLPPRRIIIPSILETLVNSRVDVIHAHSMMSQPTEMSLWAAKIKKIPFVYTPHFHPWQSYKASILERRLRRSYEEVYFKNILKKSDAIIAVSNIEKNIYVEKFKIDSNKIFVISNGINPKEMEINEKYAESIYRKYDIKKNKKYILFMGLLTLRKSPLQALKVFNIVKNYLPDADMIIAGRKRDQYPKIKNYIKKNKLEERVKVVGYLSDRRRSVLLRRADVLLMPSNYEAFGMIYIEALYHKTPVISTNVGGIPFAVRNRVDGFLVQSPKNIQSMAKYTIRLLKDNNLRKQMGENGKKRVEQKFIWADNAKKLEEVYKNLIKINKEKK